MQIVGLFRFPVKGLSPEPVDSVVLEAGRYVPGDRLFAVENGPSGYDPAEPRHQPKIKYIQLMRDERLATLATRYDPATARLTIDDGAASVEADTTSAEGRGRIETFLQAFMGAEARGALRLLASCQDDFRFTDSRIGYVSLLNRASVEEIGRMVGRPVDSLRFRANVTVSGLPPFAELDLVGSEWVGPNGVRLRVTKRTVRCAAVNVDPETGARDMEIPKALMRELGHMDCGVYASVIEGGELGMADCLERVQGRLDLGGPELGGEVASRQAGSGELTGR